MIKIVSGGQTGVDRAALDVALFLGLPCGGWCPRGRLAEDGVINERYPLQETADTRYSDRTRLNVHDSDGTLILNPVPLRGGTALTLKYARRMRRPVIMTSMRSNRDIARIRKWIHGWEIRTLNVAGPRESKRPGIYDQSYSFLQRILSDPALIDREDKTPAGP